MVEMWRDVPGYNGKYQASYAGSVRKVLGDGKFKSIKVFKMKSCKRGWFYVNLYSEKGKVKRLKHHQVMAWTFLGKPKNGEIIYHKNGIPDDNFPTNLAYITKQALGKIVGAKATRRVVCEIDKDGEITNIYSSARDAAKATFMSRYVIEDRCNRKTKSIFAPNGYAYAWEENEKEVDNLIQKIKKGAINFYGKGS